MSFKFSETESAKASNYLRPGVYAVKITNVEAGKAKSGTPFIEFTFEAESGSNVKEKFMVTTNAIARLQYLHEYWSGKKLDKDFKSEAEVIKYFVEKFSSPKVPGRTIIVGGERNGKVVYANLPYTGFIVTADDNDLEEGEFEKDGDLYNKYVRDTNRTTAASGKKQGILNDDDDDSNDDDDDTEDEVEETPPPAKKKTTAAAPAKKAAPAKGKATKKVEEEEESEETDDKDLDW